MLNSEHMVTAHGITATVREWRAVGAEFYDDGTLSRLPFGIEPLLLTGRLETGGDDWRALAWVARWRTETQRQREHDAAVERAAQAQLQASTMQRTAAGIAHATARRSTA